MATEKKLDWKTVDVDTLPKGARKLYDQLKEAQKASATAKAAFEKDFFAVLVSAKVFKADDHVQYGYRFGQLAVAVGEAKTSKTKEAAIRFE